MTWIWSKQSTKLNKPTHSVSLILSHDILYIILFRNTYSRAVYHISLEIKDAKSTFWKKNRLPSWKLIFLLQNCHSVELYREKKFKNYSCSNLMPKQTICIDIRANISRKQNKSRFFFARCKQKYRVAVAIYAN